MVSMKSSADEVAAHLEERMNHPGIDSRSVTDDEVRMAVLVAYIKELEEKLGEQNGKL